MLSEFPHFSKHFIDFSKIRFPNVSSVRLWYYEPFLRCNHLFIGLRKKDGGIGAPLLFPFCRKTHTYTEILPHVSVDSRSQERKGDESAV